MLPAVTISASYVGSGSNQTVWHSQPANPGHHPDHNFAHDSETQRWSLRFTSPLTLSACALAPCTLRQAAGTTAVAADIDHVHVDGIYRQLNRTVRCRLHSRTASGRDPGASLRYQLVDRGRAIAVTALNPVGRALLQLRSACPSQGGDSVDGLADNYLGPGWSLAPGWGANRWFTSATVVVKLRDLRAGHAVAVPVGLTRQGTPPRNCATRVRWEQCRTTGQWSGLLQLTAKRG